jgi:hypothetical protein
MEYKRYGAPASYGFLRNYGWGGGGGEMLYQCPALAKHRREILGPTWLGAMNVRTASPGMVLTVEESWDPFREPPRPGVHKVSPSGLSASSYNEGRFWPWRKVGALSVTYQDQGFTKYSPVESVLPATQVSPIHKSALMPGMLWCSDFQRMGREPWGSVASCCFGEWGRSGKIT